MHAFELEQETAQERYVAGYRMPPPGVHLAHAGDHLEDPLLEHGAEKGRASG
eukprot:CAMPEP_0185200582 /NCGR_PEP_ID=MMETSP1140-20130426/47605_1 /TAXON_ID=298111 /ORGANISM="Pavlova sp., Strain CCMP459" /LENGTH=51 /DNA_ID=CAMNT_0027767931 /DNA_START=6 /DNA_END=157 /DNA_ORIENTATION=-